MKAGYDLRLYREFGENAGRQAGDYLMRNNAAFTRQQDNSTSQNWQDVATFLLGLPTSGSIEINGTRLNNTWYHGLFVQDDWRLSEPAHASTSGCATSTRARRPTRENRNVRGFDPDATLAITNAAQAAYAASPIPAAPAVGLPRARRAAVRVSDSAAGILERRQEQLQPRAGLAYQLNPLTVAARRGRCLHGPVHHRRHLPAGVLAVHLARADARSRAHVPGDARQPVP